MTWVRDEAELNAEEVSDGVIELGGEIQPNLDGRDEGHRFS